MLLDDWPYKIINAMILSNPQIVYHYPYIFIDSWKVRFVNVL